MRVHDLTATLLRSRVADLPQGTFTVRVVGGGGSITIDGAAPAPLLVGKSEVCDLRLDDPEVSRRHLSLEIVGQRLRLVDLASSNGTHVGALRVCDVLLDGGERVRIGRTELEVIRDERGHNREVPFGSGFGRMLGESRTMRRLYPLCDKLAKSNVPVLIEGETGTGKEVLAEALHEQGPLADCPFVVFDCTAVPPNLLESELFGHEKGAFTGAHDRRKGVFEQAHGGTLFIDEIGELDLALQPKLLRAIERGEVRRVGGNEWLHVEVRILAATRRDLDAEVQAGRFRDDLFHRLAVARVELPPLRSRAGDVALLARHFWRQAGAEGEPPPALLSRLEVDGSWSGNVRALRNAILRAVALGDETDAPLHGEAIEPPPSSVAPRDSEDFIDRVVASGRPLSQVRAAVTAELERRYLSRVLAEHGGNVSRAAAASGIARRHFQRLRARTR